MENTVNRKIGARGYMKVPTPAYTSWRAMLARVFHKNAPYYRNYGGRGITVCDSWLTFSNFLKDMGERPENTSLDRVNNLGNYEPNNCRWATKQEQIANRRPTSEWKPRRKPYPKVKK